MNQQLQPVITTRVNAWREKGINFQLKTVDRNVTVEEWLKANEEFTTTTQKYKKTVINEKDKTTIITTKRTRTITSRSSVNVFRDITRADNKLKAIANEDIATIEVPKDEMNPIGETINNQKERINKNNQIEVPVPEDLVSSKKFSLPVKPRKQTTRIRQNKVASPQKTMKRLSPQKKIRNRKKSVPKQSTSKQNDSHLPTVTNEDEDVFDNTNVVQVESDRPQNQATSFPKTRKAAFKARPKIVIYSPGADTSTFGTKINDELMSVTKGDLEKRIDPKYHKNHNLGSLKKCIVPVNQKIVYEPPSNMENISEDNSESDDDLLTSYTRTGHFLRLNSK